VKPLHTPSCPKVNLLRVTMVIVLIESEEHDVA
jgi:hypothetical protein